MAEPPLHESTAFLFTNDLRLRDNLALCEAAQHSRRLVCIYCINPDEFKPGRYTLSSMGDHRWSFIRKSLNCLDSELAKYQQKLVICFQSPESTIQQLVNKHAISAVYRSTTSGYRENRYWQALKQHFHDVTFKEVSNNTLFHEGELPFFIEELPPTFSQFRRKVEHHSIQPPISQPSTLPPPCSTLDDITDNVPTAKYIEQAFEGGESAGIAHLTDYFSSLAPARYKETRNALQGNKSSTHFSPWLAHGCISARQIVFALKQFESDIIANESTYWILFELLWREYFYWYAIKHGVKLFKLHGIHPSGKACCYYPERFQKWCAGNTPWPIINACMKELQATGYLSNRGRQLVASCLINELSMDWRYGAAWFEHQLIDYDVASNWGNWQYLTGVGADPKGPRHFNLQKQAELYDPDSLYIRRWQGEKTYPLDSVDMVDWPILPDQQKDR